ncbi:ABC transporter permease [Histidinibacterium lentulum]|uniref:ABC transporter permease n=1 Tax=Histidinibacterium lentulum TaxID=2480588 RepID=A0A3N2R9S8_9RHOB|nr:ABC transporter permease [Histidinibacterium lentulum]ROU04173.1 ABC transporter permease [Histidinibacterium lentulum]
MSALPDGDGPLSPTRSMTARQMARWRFTRNPSAMIGAFIVLSVFVAAIFAPWLAPSPESAGSFVDFRNRHAPPSWDNPMGTDNVGRDILSRVLYGYRVSLGLVVGVLGVAVPLGVVLGLCAGYFGGWIETGIMRFTDVMLALPPLAMALAITAVLSPNLVNAMIAITLLWWTWHTRLIYRIVKAQMNEDYVEAAKVAGATHRHILFRELLPNCIPAIAVKSSLDAGFVILFGASLSFLGLGIQPPTPDLGTMVATGSEYMPDMWWQAVMPGLAILYAILGFNLLGDGLRDMLDVEL